MSKRIKAKQFILSFLTGKDYLVHKPALPYLAVDTQEHKLTNNWHEHHVIQFESVAEAEKWLDENVAKNE